MFRLPLAILAVFSLALVFAPSAQAAIVWEGDVSPTNVGYTFGTFNPDPNPGFTFNSPAGFTTQNRPTANSLSALWQITGATAAQEFNSTNGWVLEFRVDAITNTSTDPLFRTNVGIFLSDNSGRAFISLQPDKVVFNPEQNNATTMTVPLGPGFHRYKISRAAGNTTSFTVQIDGGAPFVLPNSSAASSTPIIQFGDVTTNNGTSHAVWDYVYINNPVPEPSSFAMFAVISALGLLWKRRNP